jgi:putative ATP-binding cassette transporter
MTLLTFTVLLWQISHVFSIKIFGYTVRVHGYLVWIAFIYTIVGTGLIKHVGKKLAGLLFAQEKREANFRFSLIRVRENAEPISFYKAVKFEKISLLKSFDEIIKNTRQVISKRSQIACFSAFYGQIALILPFVLTFSFFFAKKITLGGVIQISSAFDHVNKASSWIINSYQSISLLQAVTGRLEQFSESLDLWTISYNKNKIKIIRRGKDLKIEKLELHLPSGHRLLAIDKLHIKGKSYLIEGRSGLGKTTFFKALSGLWVSGVGKITLPHNKKILFISQKNYMPIGKLKFCFTYPLTESAEHKDLTYLMKRVGLDHLIDKLEEEGEWGHVLSLGEQQKIAILRAIIIKPDVIFLDEATSAMDRKSKETVYNLLKTKLKKTKIISIGHERYLRRFHNEIIAIKDDGIEIKKIDRMVASESD